jgi:X-X-X-Leu-X-X-Gly heptad repeat protein
LISSHVERVSQLFVRQQGRQQRKEMTSDLFQILQLSRSLFHLREIFIDSREFFLKSRPPVPLDFQIHLKSISRKQNTSLFERVYKCPWRMSCEVVCFMNSTWRTRSLPLLDHVHTMSVRGENGMKKLLIWNFSTRLHSGAKRLHSGAKRLHSGAKRLHSGAKPLHSAAKRLHLSATNQKALFKLTTGKK